MLLTLVLLAQTATAIPAPAPPPAPAKLSGGFGQKAVAPGKARVTLTDQNVAQPGQGSGRGTFSVTGARAAAPAAPAGPEAGGPPLPGDDVETVWKERIARLRAALAEAQAELDAADRANTVVAHGTPGRTYYLLMAIRDSALAPYRAKVASIRREMDGLPEECRKTPGCQPGWLR